MNYRIYSLKPYKDRKLRFLAEWLKKHHITADTITISGLVFGLSATVSLLANQNVLALVLIFISIIADLLDGTLARISNSDTLRGKLLDAFSDRMVETAWVGGLIFRGILPWWGLALPLGSVLLLIMRWWAYRNGLGTSFIRITRFERMTAMMGMVVIPWRFLMLLIYWLVTLGTFISGLMICQTIFKELRRLDFQKYAGITKDIQA
jgi:phosphatidylglycerophosphate synthase